jgi:hypothetical protein
MNIYIVEDLSGQIEIYEDILKHKGFCRKDFYIFHR